MPKWHILRRLDLNPDSKISRHALQPRPETAFRETLGQLTHTQDGTSPDGWRV